MCIRDSFDLRTIGYAYANGTGTGTFNPNPPSNPPQYPNPGSPTASLDPSGNLIVKWSSLQLARFTGGTASTATKKLTITMPDTPDDHAILTNWFFANEWYRASYYSVAPAYAPRTLPSPPLPYSPSCGTCITVGSTNTNKLVLIMMGRALGTQARPGDVRNYLDGTNGTNAYSGTLSYMQLPHGGDSNDATTVAQ